ncbi:serine protease Do [Fulvimarina manganoxydans]|uniref:Probable periplasmic serine endoprotease DegP-like n=1 Tax=Fulvimarina manganoxydans TaxID=937218 RepID=A0A1W1Z6Q3_9HYPH|nr:Do family serine endopeptidase [Fulvimarina manganoxydans]MCK5934148.1 Do family serine endopeptidase [Fulvimarina manganoxydans]MEE2952996.1 Do family serine endopeptidase [Pseudomonadota bacterium]SMC43992.1 serine protease Do [Fulvimarina manganoxydans]
MRNSASNPKKRNKFIAGILAAGVAGAALSAGVVSNTPAVLAAPVTVDTPQQNFGFADVVSKVSPAVVSVRVTQDVKPTADMGRGGFASPFDNLPEDHPLRRFFDIPGQGQTPPGMAPHRGNRQAIGQGSGFFISDDGYVVTNNHVVENGSTFTIVMDDGTEYDAKLIGTDERTDLALLKVDAPNTKFTYVEFGDDNAARVGDWVVAVGNPFGLGGSVTAGIISARGRDIGAGPYDDFLQIDAAVNRGNSGGPAFGLDGKVIGVNTAIFSPSGGNVGIAFAIPASVAKDVVASLRQDGTVERGWLGVQIGQVTEDIAEAVGLSEAEGAIVTMPDNETPASKAGIQTGDVITAVDGETVTGPRELARKIANYRPGSTVEITVWRDNASKTVDVTLGDLSQLDEAASIDAPRSNGSPVNPSSLSGYGITLTPSEDGKGVVVTDVDPDSSAAEKGFQAGDTIVAVNGSEVADQQDVSAAIENASKNGRRAALFQLRNGDGQNRFVALPIEKS